MPTPRRRVNAYVGPNNGMAAGKSGRALSDMLIGILDQVYDASEEIMLEALEPTFEKSQMYCPVETGKLKNSGYLEVNAFRGNPRVEIGYGFGGSPKNKMGKPYTAYVHEMLELKHEPPTRAKWLQAAVMEDLDLIMERLSIGYKTSLGL